MESDSAPMDTGARLTQSTESDPATTMENTQNVECESATTTEIDLAPMNTTHDTASELTAAPSHDDDGFQPAKRTATAAQAAAPAPPAITTSNRFVCDTAPNRGSCDEPPAPATPVSRIRQHSPDNTPSAHVSKQPRIETITVDYDVPDAALLQAADPVEAAAPLAADDANEVSPDPLSPNNNDGYANH